jgi:AraC-like DNA-binding protein
MRTVLRAVTAPRGERAEHWRATLDSVFSGIDLRLDAEPDQRDELVVSDAGSLQVIESRSGPGQVVRTARHVRRHDPGRYVLFVQAQGSDVGEQRDHRAAYRPGDLTLLDLSAPLRCTFTHRRAVMLSYPKAICPLPASEVDMLAGTWIDGSKGTAALISGLVRQLSRHLEADDEAVSARVGAAVLDLLHVGLAARLDRAAAVGPGSQRNALKTRSLAYIEEHLADPNLTPATVAAAQHVSLRHLHRVFEDTHEGVAELIRRRRLDRARADLLNPTLLHRPVASVGARWGFADPAHFNRTFKSATGLPPGAFRQAYGYGIDSGQ